MQVRIEFSAEAERDFALIFDHPFECYCRFGESVEAALDHCEARIHDIPREADRLAATPFRGESHEDLLPGLRHLTTDRAIFFGNQDQVRHLLTRMLKP